MAQLCDRDHSALLIVDVQERLAAAMLAEERDRVVRNAGVLVGAAGLLQIPALVSEQYTKGLGPTVAALSAQMGDSVQRFEKTCFSCCGAESLMHHLGATHRRQIVLAGMEAHVCVLQTAIELQQGGFEVYLAADAICSRNPENRQNAVDRMQKAGVVVTNTEAVLFEWLRDARDPHFKAISALVR